MHDLERLFGAVPLLLQNAIVVDALHIAILIDAGKVTDGLPKLLALVYVGSTAHEMRAGGEQRAGLVPVPIGVAKARVGSRLVVVRPKEGIPASARCHALLPGAEELAQRTDVWARERPLLRVGIVNLEVMEVKGHAQLVAVGIGVAYARVE